MSLPDPKPHSEDIEVYDVWNENWKKLTGDEDEKERSISISIENVLERSIELTSQIQINIFDFLS
jgi:hypothetical protein